MSKRAYLIRKADRRNPDAEQTAGIIATGVGAGGYSFARGMASENATIARDMESGKKLRFKFIDENQRNAANAKTPAVAGVYRQAANEMRVNQAHAINRQAKYLKDAKKLNRIGWGSGIGGAAVGGGLLLHASRKDTKPR